MGEEGPVLSMTAGVEEFAVTTGDEETVGVTIGATGVEETAVGVATTGYVVVQGQESLIIKVVACEWLLLLANAKGETDGSCNAAKSARLTSVTVWILPLMDREVAEEQ